MKGRYVNHLLRVSDIRLLFSNLVNKFRNWLNIYKVT